MKKLETMTLRKYLTNTSAFLKKSENAQRELKVNWKCKDRNIKNSSIGSIHYFSIISDFCRKVSNKRRTNKGKVQLHKLEVVAL